MSRTQLYNIWATVRSSLWFIPSLMILTAFCTSFLTVFCDTLLQDELLLTGLRSEQNSLLSHFLIVGPEGARSVLSTIAGSMITVAGVTFSITIVALTLASSQFGPRILTNFMQDKSTQIVLGVFVATFLYCLLVLRSVRSTESDIFVPIISVNISVFIAVLNAGILIYFIHNIATSIKAETVISEVYLSLQNNIDRIFHDIDPKDDDTPGNSSHIHSDKLNSEETLLAEHDGYIQAIDYGKLLDICVDHELFVHLHLRAGLYATHTTPIATVKYVSELDDSTIKQLQETIIYGRQRTPEQDIEYAIHQLVEIGVRSLSPGINDPYTAISCIDYLSSSLCHLAGKHFPDSHCYDNDGQLRIITKPVQFSDVLDTAFNQLRQYSQASISVTIHLMEAYIQLGHSLKREDLQKDLLRHATMLHHSAETALKEQYDKESFQQRYDTLLDNLDVKKSS